MDDFRKCPITRQLLSPVGFPLEQLSVSVSLGKSPKYTTLEEVLALNWNLHIHMWQCSRSASWGSFQASNFFKFCRHTHVQAMGGLSVPEQVRPLAPPTSRTVPALLLVSLLWTFFSWWACCQWKTGRRSLLEQPLLPTGTRTAAHSGWFMLQRRYEAAGVWRV